MFLLIEFGCGTPPSCLTVRVGWWWWWVVVAYSILVSAPVLDLIGTWLGLGLAGFGTKGLGTGLDNKYTLYYSVSVV